MQLCCLHNHWYYGHFWLPLCRYTISHSLICNLFTAFTVQSRFSPVPINTFLTCRYLYTAEFFGTAFRVLRTFFRLRCWCRNSALCCSFSDCQWRCGSIHFILRPASLPAWFYKLFTTLQRKNLFRRWLLATELPYLYSDRTFTC